MDIRENKLDNGLKIITIKKNTKFASIRVGVKVGSMDEQYGQEGISHFVEHLLFKGTTNRTQEALFKDLALYCGEYNGMTYRDKTIYMYDILSEDLDKALEVSSDMIINSLMDEASVNKEMSVILSELNLYSDELPDYARDTAFAHGFKNQKLAVPEAGYTHSVNNITTSQIRNHYKTYYVPENSAIVIVSPYEHDYVLDLIQKHFDSWENSNLPRNERTEDLVLNATEATEKINNKNQDVIYHIFLAQNLTQEERVYLDLAAGRLGFGMSCLLWNKLRNELGIAYDTRAYLTQYGNTSIFECYGIVSSDDFESGKTGIRESIDSLFDRDILEDGLVNTKKEYIYEYLSLIESNNRLSEHYVSTLLNSEDILDIMSYIDIIENATREDIINVLNKYLINPCTIYLNNN